MDVNMKEIMEKITEKNIEGRINCKVALELADELGVAPGIIGSACNELEVKISNCQLGCFQ